MTVEDVDSHHKISLAGIDGKTDPSTAGSQILWRNARNGSEHSDSLRDITGAHAPRLPRDLDAMQSVFVVYVSLHTSVIISPPGPLIPPEPALCLSETV